MVVDKPFTRITGAKRVQTHRLLVGGIAVEVMYRKDKFDPFQKEGDYVKQVKFTYLLHGRERNHKDSIELGHKLFDEYYAYEKVHDAAPLVIFTWDLTNHGVRLLDENANKPSNPKHADFISMVDMSVMELKSLADYLPVYIPAYDRIGKVIKTVCGVSMGGHIAVRAVTRFPKYFYGAIPIIGTFDLTSLIWSRVTQSEETMVYINSYGVFKKHLKDENKFPKALFEVVSNEDSNIVRFYDTRNLKTLALFGGKDEVVPPLYSQPFLDAIAQRMKYPPEHIDEKAIFQAIVYPDCGHLVNDEMTKHAAEFLLLLSDSTFTFE